MSIEGIGNVNGYSKNYMNISHNQNKQKVDSFYNKVEEASTLSAATDASKTTKNSGDIIMSIPPSINSTYGIDIIKSTEEMTMDEYKQYICNKIANLPMSTCFRTQHTGQLVIKDEAFEHMKSDPEYEETVIKMLREGFTVQHMYAPCYGMQVIGGTMEETYGYGVPLNNSSSNNMKTSNEKTWWEKRHEKIEELLEEQAKKVQDKCAAQKKVKMQELFAFQQQQGNAYSNFLAGENPNVESVLVSTLQTITTETESKAIEAKKYYKR